jgi:hypothetical protein
MSYTKQEVETAVKEADCYSAALENLGLVPKGANYKRIKELIALHKVSIKHFSTQGRKGKQRPATAKVETEKYLSNEVYIRSNDLKQRLLKENYFQWLCQGCNEFEWRGVPIPLELDHINGNSKDNCLSNLRLLCPNCHALTSTYRGRGARKWTDRDKICPQCNKTFEATDKKQKYCGVECGYKAKLYKNVKIQWPSTEELVNRVNATNLSVVSKELGVCYATLKQHIEIRTK